MSEWQPIETAPNYLRVLDKLLERSSAVDVWGTVFVWATDAAEPKAKPSLYQADYVEWRDGGKNRSYWKDHQRTDDNHELKPTHWQPLPEPPK